MIPTKWWNCISQMNDLGIPVLVFDTPREHEPWPNAYRSVCALRMKEAVMNETQVLDEKVVGKPGDNKLTPTIVREPLRSIQKKLPLRVLSKADFEHWQTYGFVVVKQAVPTA